MGIEKKMFRGMFDPGEMVELRQICFTAGKVFSPGKYLAGELPDTAFEMGLVDKLPPVKVDTPHDSASLKSWDSPV